MEGYREQRINVNNKYQINIDEYYQFIKLGYFQKIISQLLFGIIELFINLFYLKVICSHKIIGRKHIEELNNKGFISISNHCHYLDSIITGAAIKPRVPRFTSIQRNFETPLLSKILKTLRTLPIPHDCLGLLTIVNPIKKLINNGEIVHFYPEAELWHLSLELGKFHLGAFYLSNYIHCPIVPLVHLFKPKYFLGIKLPTFFLSITTVVGEPIYPKTNNGNHKKDNIKESREKAYNWMYQQLEDYKKEINEI